MNEVQNIVFEELEDLRKRIIANIDSTGRKASGRTADSMRTEITKQGGTLFGRAAFDVLETGRKPGNVPAGFYQIIRQWMIDKGFSFDSLLERNSFAYLVSRKIAKEGTALFRSGAKNDVYSNEIPEAVERITKRVGTFMKMNVESIKLNG